MEITFKVEQDETRGTPSRFEVRKNLASVLNTDLEFVYVKRMETKTGTLITVGGANVYDSVEQAKLLESNHILLRNAPPEKLNKGTVE